MHLIINSASFIAYYNYSLESNIVYLLVIPETQILKPFIILKFKNYPIKSIFFHPIIMLISLTIIDHPTHKIISHAHDLSKYSFLHRGPIKELLPIFLKKLSESVQTPEFQIIEHNIDKTVHTFFMQMKDDHLYIACADNKYPAHVAARLLAKMQVEKLDTLLKKYSDHTKVDVMHALNAELDETKNVLTRTLEDVLGRGEKLDNLVRDAEDLSVQTKMLFKMSKSKNRCFC